MASKVPPHKGTPLVYAVPTLSQARAIQAFASGEASPEQQKQVMNWIVKDACRAGQEMLVPGQPDTSAYLAGRLSVSLQIGWVLGQPVESFRKGEID